MFTAKTYAFSLKLKAKNGEPCIVFISNNINYMRQYKDKTTKKDLTLIAFKHSGHTESAIVVQHTVEELWELMNVKTIA